ncbi:MAG: protein kinase family protein [Actinomycetota bacterium]|nr:protein kinase family protein [Actinomycetota bacterium]
MTSATTGLPDRYRPFDEVGPVETTATGVIHCWRAKDRILNRDVAIRVHTPGGAAAREWISRALTAGGLATPALAMVYDAAEGSGGGAGATGVAYVVNEWIEGRTLAERLAEGPMPEREARTVLRRLAEGVASAHRVGLAVGGLTPETVVLRSNGLVGLRSVPAASGTVQGDIAALGELLEYCLTGRRPGAAPAGPSAGMPPDLAALVRRARSTEPGGGLSSVAAMAALLAERPRTGHTAEPLRASDESDSGWLRRLRERREEERAEGPGNHVAVDPAPTRDASGTAFPPPHGRSLPPVPGRQYEDDDEDDLLPLSAGAHRADDDRDADADLRGEEPGRPGRRRLLLVGLPLAALAVVVALAVYLGSNVISVSDDITGDQAPVPSAPSSSPAPAEPTPAPADVPPPAIAGATVYDPFGDGDPDNPDEVPLSFDGDPSTAWSTVTYRGSASFGNLKDGIGVVYDLGSEQALAGVDVSGTVAVAVEVRVGDEPEGDLESYQVVADGTLGLGADLSFDEPVTTRYVLLWITRLAPSDGGFSAEIAEVTLTPAS